MTSDGEGLDPEQILGPLDQAMTDGIIVLFGESPEFLRQVARLKRPTVLLAGQDPEMQVPSVGIGNRYGARLGTDYLLRLGHRRIGLLTWRGRYTIRQREDGYSEAIEEAGLESLIYRLPGFEPDTAEREITRLIADGTFDEVTALFRMADNVALAALRALRLAGRPVPSQVSVLGFDDVVAGEFATPALTIIHAPLRVLGIAALEELERQASAPAAQNPACRVELGCSLVKRQSRAPPGGLRL